MMTPTLPALLEPIEITLPMAPLPVVSRWPELRRRLLWGLAALAFSLLRISLQTSAGDADRAWRADHARANPAAWAALERDWPDGSRSVRGTR
jgi:hypothetical protein